MNTENTHPVRLFVTTDLHYLSKSLIQNEQMFDSLTQYDGKLTKYSDQILEALVQQTIKKKPNALIICGDLTFNGEMQSLLEIKEPLRYVQSQGIPVFVIPGNHDIDYAHAMAFTEDGIVPVPNISQGQFKSDMKEFGYQQAVSCDASSFSYMVHLDGVILIFLDANTSNHKGYLSGKTIQWMNQQLEWAADRKMKAVTISHQNVLEQSGLLSDGFVMVNNEQVLPLLRDRVLVHLSGHSHIQHCSHRDTLTDICTESLSLYPLQYGILTIDSDAWCYENAKLHILQDQAKQNYYASTRQQVIRSLRPLNINEKDKETMISYMQDINALYFQGKLNASHIQYYKTRKGWLLWRMHGDGTFWKAYIESMFRDYEKDR